MFAINHAATALISSGASRTCRSSLSFLGAGNGVCLGRVELSRRRAHDNRAVVRYVGDITSRMPYRTPC
jgi:hypothetical protein